jgi:hypothetical protein
MLLLPSLCQCSVCSKRAPHLYPRIHENSMPWMFTSLFQEILPGKRSEKYPIRKPNQETLQIFSRCPRRLRVLITSASGLAVLERPMSITIFCVNYFSNFRQYRKRSERVAVPGSAITHCFAGPPGNGVTQRARNALHQKYFHQFPWSKAILSLLESKFVNPAWKPCDLITRAAITG